MEGLIPGVYAVRKSLDLDINLFLGQSPYILGYYISLSIPFHALLPFKLIQLIFTYAIIILIQKPEVFQGISMP